MIRVAPRRGHHNGHRRGTTSGWAPAVRRLQWSDELRAAGKVIELPLVVLPQHQDDQTDHAQARGQQPDRQDNAARSLVARLRA